MSKGYRREIKIEIECGLVVKEIKKMTYINSYIRNDAPEPWQLGLQDSASPISEGILRIHNEIIYYLIIILVSICWIIISIIIKYNESSNKFQYKYLNHGTLIELI